MIFDALVVYTQMIQVLLFASRIVSYAMSSNSILLISDIDLFCGGLKDIIMEKVNSLKQKTQEKKSTVSKKLNKLSKMSCGINFPLELG